MLQIASHVNVTFAKPILKRDLRTLIVARMAELRHTMLPAQGETSMLDSATAGKSSGLQSWDSPSGMSADGREGDEESGRQKTPLASTLFPPTARNPAMGRDESLLRPSPAGGAGKGPDPASPVAAGDPLAGDRG